MNKLYDHQQLRYKAIIFINRALQSDERDFEERALWAACALELVAKSALAKVSPVLIADPQTGGGRSSMIAAGISDDDEKFVSISANTAFQRCKQLAPSLDLDECLKIARHRNAYIHSGALFAPRMTEDSWWEHYWAQFNILIAAQSAKLADFVGDDHYDEISSILERNSMNVKAHALTLMQQAAQRFERVQRGELSTRELAIMKSAGSRFDFTYEGAAPCPACGNLGTIYGDVVIDTNWVFDYNGYPESNVSADAFACPHCGLELDGYEAITETGLDDSFEVEDPHADFGGPEYGND